MAISLEAFRKISNGTENVGEIRLNANGTGLEKINNHVYKTSKNNVRLTTEQNRQVRQALVDALSTLPLGDDLSKLENLLIGEGRDVQALSRDFVRHIFSAVFAPEKDRGMRIADLTTIDTSLRNRTITCRCKRINGELLVKSAKSEAFEISINELADKDLKLARETLKEVPSTEHLGKALKDVDEDIKHFQVELGLATRKVKRIADAVTSLINSDSCLINGQGASGKNSPAEKIKKQIATLYHDNEADIIRLSKQTRNASTKLNAFLERKVRLIYANAGIEDANIIGRHIRGIFGDTLGDSSLSGIDLIDLRKSFFQVGQGLVHNHNEIKNIRTKFLDYVKSEISNSKLPSKKRTALQNMLDSIRTSGPFERFKMCSHDVDWSNDPARAEKLEKLLERDYNALFDKFADDQEITNLKSEMWKRLIGLGLGV